MTRRVVLTLALFALAAPLGACSMTAQVPTRGVYPGLGELDERGIARLARRRVRLPDRPTAALVWIEEPAVTDGGVAEPRPRHERDALLPEVIASIEGAPLAWVQAAPSALVPAGGPPGALDLRGLRSAGAHFQSDLVLLVQTQVSERIAADSLISGILLLAESLASPVRRVVAAASAEVCAVDVRSGVLVACGQGAGESPGRLAFVLARRSAQRELTREALLAGLRVAGERLRSNLGQRIAAR